MVFFFYWEEKNMNRSIYQISLDMHKDVSQYVLHCKKNDSARSICVTLKENGKPYEVTGDSVPVFSALKADGKKLYNECEVVDGKIVYNLTEQSTNVVGLVECEIEVYGSIDGAERLITSPKFTILVHDTIYNGEEIESVDEVSALTALIVGAKSAIDNTNNASNKANTAANNALDATEKALSAAQGADEASDAALKSIDKVNELVDELKEAYANGKLNGKDGKSAYTYALQGGYKGSEEDFYKALSEIDNFETKGTAQKLINELCEGEIASQGELIDGLIQRQLQTEELDKKQSKELSELEEKIADLMYVPIVINSFTNNKNTAEIGSTITGLIFNWEINKTPEKLEFEATEVDCESTSLTVDGLELKANKSWTLKATDERGAVSTKATSVSFLNGAYYGASKPGTYNSEFILKLNKVLTTSKVRSITVNAGEGEYIYYCIPARFGTCNFNVGGFDGGFGLVATIDFTNISGYTESYLVYKSDQTNLGDTTVKIS